MALAASPKVNIADEPTTALDATVQAQILELLMELRERLDMALLLITHDIGVVAGMADDVAVMYAGKIVEHGPARAVLKHPDHPYTRGLLASVPPPDATPGTRFRGLPGTPPDLMVITAGCPFRERCVYAIEQCATQRPPLEPVTVSGDQRSACHVHPLVAERDEAREVAP
jgi:oligopeptide/dipeptide ABC transporter ATP-binding protein